MLFRSRCALAVAIAASVYRSIGKRVIARGDQSWSTDGQIRVRIGSWGKVQACLVGVYSFLKTIPFRILDRRSISAIDQIWRCS